MHRWASWRFPKLALCVAATVACSSSGNDDDIAPSPQGGGTGGIAGAPPLGGMTGAMGGVGASAGDAAPVAGNAGAAGGGNGGAAGIPITDAGMDAEIEDPAFADCFAPSTVESGGSTPYPGGTWAVPAATHGTVIETDIQIEMSDGVVLIGDVSYPTDLATGQRASGDFPVLLTQNPYGAAFGAAYGEIFVTHGYIFASVDVRGTSRSGGGVHDLFSPREAMDGAELVMWAAALEGSDGTVGLQGCSQLGINQLETATLLGPGSPVKAMIPACPSGDFYRDTAFDNGIPAVTGGFLVPEAAMGDDTAYYREYWKQRDRVARAPAIARADIPMLLHSGWHEPGALGSFELYTVLQNVAHGRPASDAITAGKAVSGKYQVIMGDWGHGGGLDLGLELQFYDTWIKGIDTGLATDTATPLHIAELGGTKRWINARCYPLVDAYTPFYLASDGSLAPSAESAAAEDQLEWVAQDVPSDVLEYATEPFANGAMLAGPIAVQLQVTSSNTNAQLFVEAFDRAANGALTRIGFGSIVGALRELDLERSWSDKNGLPARPFLALDELTPMTAGEKTQLDVPLWPTVRSIEPGHSIVVRISVHPPNEECIAVIAPPVGCYPTEPMLETLPGGMYKIHLGGELGSLISLPLLDHGTFEAVDNAASPTGTPELPLPIAW